MLDNNIIKQLTEVFKALSSEITLSYDDSNHSKQSELLAMLEGVSSTSEKIILRKNKRTSSHPRFTLQSNEHENRIVFSGVPGGHEFSSLILAILNSDLKGKLPDEGIINRIKALEGSIKLRTFISLSCENCPEIVQSLNLMAVLNPSISHEMIDGEFAENEIKRLKIQGVPAVFIDDELISSGKSHLGALLEKLEAKYSSSQAKTSNTKLGQYDVVVIGGGPAGISSAIYTARKGLKTAVIAEVIGGQLQDTKGIENFISIPYTEGPKLSANLFEHLTNNEIDVFEHRRVEKIINNDHKEIFLKSGEQITTRSMIVATGAKWRELGVKGEKEYLGRGVAFCPHCDGPYYKGKDISVIGGGNSGVEAAIDLAGIVKSVTLIEFAPELKADSVLVKKLESLTNIKIIKNARTDEVLGDGDKVTSLNYEDRASGEIKNIKLDGVFVQIGLLPNSSFVKDLVATNRFGEIIIDEKCKTNISGVYAAGDVSTVPFKQIVISVGEGAKAGLSAFEDLMLAS